MRYILAAALAVFATSALACDDYRSEKNPHRTLHITKGGEYNFIIKDGKQTLRYFISSAGTGTGITVAKPETILNDPPTGEILETAQEGNKFWMGPEVFIATCK